MDKTYLAKWKEVTSLTTLKGYNLPSDKDMFIGLGHKRLITIDTSLEPEIENGALKMLVFDHEYKVKRQFKQYGGQGLATLIIKVLGEDVEEWHNNTIEISRDNENNFKVFPYKTPDNFDVEAF